MRSLRGPEPEVNIGLGAGPLLMWAAPEAEPLAAWAATSPLPTRRPPHVAGAAETDVSS